MEFGGNVPRFSYSLPSRFDPDGYLYSPGHRPAGRPKRKTAHGQIQLMRSNGPWPDTTHTPRVMVFTPP